MTDLYLAWVVRGGKVRKTLHPTYFGAVEVVDKAMKKGGQVKCAIYPVYLGEALWEGTTEVSVAQLPLFKGESR